MPKVTPWSGNGRPDVAGSLLGSHERRIISAQPGALVQTPNLAMQQTTEINVGQAKGGKDRYEYWYPCAIARITWLSKLSFLTLNSRPSSSAKVTRRHLIRRITSISFYP